MTRLTRFRTLLSALTCLLASSAALALEARLGTQLPDTHPQTLGARKFAELVGQKSDGRIKIKVFSSGMLGTDVQMQSQVQGGTLDFSVPATATLVGTVKSFGVLDLPFLFDTVEEADAVLDGPVGQKLMAKLPEKGLIGLAYFEHGFRNATNSRRPITRVEDFQGLKIRTMQSPMFIDLFSSLNANAVPLSVNELYTALETRTVDAQENPLIVINSNGYYEVQKYLSMTGHSYNALILIVGRTFWEKLSEGDRELLKAAAQEARLFQRLVTREMAASLRGELASKGMEINDLSPEEMRRMREPVAPMVDQYATELDPDLWGELQAELGKS